jgi:inhibitor of KinA sporulation pathway (predicted exonuclease)
MRYRNHIILDFEMNPTDKRLTRQDRGYLWQEIIEIGAVKLNADYEEVDHFSCYVRPQYNDHITREISNLTHIYSSNAFSAEPLETGLKQFAEWIGTGRTRVYSWSFSDLFQLEDECEAKQIPFPTCLGRWMNFQALYPRMLGYPQSNQLSLRDACQMGRVALDLEQCHGALYDAEVTTQLLIPILDGSYKETAKDARRFLVEGAPTGNCSLDAASGGKLAALLAAMTGEKDPVGVE